MAIEFAPTANFFREKFRKLLGRSQVNKGFTAAEAAQPVVVTPVGTKVDVLNVRGSAVRYDESVRREKYMGLLRDLSHKSPYLSYFIIFGGNLIQKIAPAYKLKRCQYNDNVVDLPRKVRLLRSIRIKNGRTIFRVQPSIRARLTDNKAKAAERSNSFDFGNYNRDWSNGADWMNGFNPESPDPFATPRQFKPFGGSRYDSPFNLMDEATRKTLRFLVANVPGIMRTDAKKMLPGHRISHIIWKARSQQYTRNVS